jgi:hypothetical protein
VSDFLYETKVLYPTLLSTCYSLHEKRPPIGDTIRNRLAIFGYKNNIKELCAIDSLMQQLKDSIFQIQPIYRNNNRADRGFYSFQVTFNSIDAFMYRSLTCQLWADFITFYQEETSDKSFECVCLNFKSPVTPFLDDILNNREPIRRRKAK